MLFDGAFLLDDLDTVAAELAAGHEWTLQFADPFAPPFRTAVPDPVQGLRAGDPIDFDAYIGRANALCAEHGPRLTIRFYGHYDDDFDAETVKLFPEARSLVVNCLSEAANLDAIGSLTNLTSLGLGVHGYKGKDLLHALPLENLDYLCLEDFGTKAMDLAPLGDATRLRELRLLGTMARNIDALACLDRLKIFSFAPVKTASLEFIGGMTGLRALKLVLGGTETLPPVSLKHLQDIAVTQTRGFRDLGPLDRFPALKRVLISDQPHLESVSTGAGNTKLEHLSFWNCPKLSRIDGLADAPALKSLYAVKTGLTLGTLSLPGSTTHAHIHTGKRRDEAAETAEIEALGLIDAAHPRADFFYK